MGDDDVLPKFNMALYGNDWGYYDGNSAWFNWGRWVLLGIIVAVSLVAFLAVRWHAIIQVRRGQHPTAGTGWLVPPSYYQSQQQHYGEVAPPYNPNVSTADAGYYDEHGNFIAKSHHPSYDAECQGESYPMADFYAHNAQPPAGPPPGNNAANVGPPPGPPPTAGSSSAADYYPPPEPPAPVKR